MGCGTCGVSVGSTFGRFPLSSFARHLSPACTSNRTITIFKKKNVQYDVQQQTSSNRGCRCAPAAVSISKPKAGRVHRFHWSVRSKDYQLAIKFWEKAIETRRESAEYLGSGSLECTALVSCDRTGMLPAKWYHCSYESKKCYCPTRSEIFVKCPIFFQSSTWQKKLADCCTARWLKRHSNCIP